MAVRNNPIIGRALTELQVKLDAAKAARVASDEAALALALLQLRDLASMTSECVKHLADADAKAAEIGEVVP